MQDPHYSLAVVATCETAVGQSSELYLTRAIMETTENRWIQEWKKAYITCLSMGINPDELVCCSTCLHFKTLVSAQLETAIPPEPCNSCLPYYIKNCSKRSIRHQYTGLNQDTEEI